MTPPLTHALKALYTAFAAPRPRVIQGCPCCIDSRRVDTLLSKPLRDLTAHDLHRYVSGAFLTVGGPTDYRYLLPRILDLAAQGDPGTPAVEIVLTGLARAGWRNWPPHEQAAIQAVLDAWFEAALTEGDHPDPWEAPDTYRSLLCGLALAGLDLKPYLARLQSPEHAQALANWRAMAVDGKTGEIHTRPTAFWADIEPVWRQVRAVLASD